MEKNTYKYITESNGTAFDTKNNIKWEFNSLNLFCHGQLYVSMSHTKSLQNIKILGKPEAAKEQMCLEKKYTVGLFSQML